MPNMEDQELTNQSEAIAQRFYPVNPVHPVVMPSPTTAHFADSRLHHGDIENMEKKYFLSVLSVLSVLNAAGLPMNSGAARLLDQSRPSSSESVVRD
jgi:hypothetical protein